MVSKEYLKGFEEGRKEGKEAGLADIVVDSFFELAEMAADCLIPMGPGSDYLKGKKEGYQQGTKEK